MNVLVRDDNAPVAIHPPGFRVKDHRKAIPPKVKLEVVIRWEGKCAHCTEKLQGLADTDFDHDPSLDSRPWDAEAKDFVPAQLDPAYIAPKHRNCHDVKSNGRGGEKRISTAGSDKGNAAKVRRLSNDQIDFRRRLLAKTEGESEPETKSRRKSGQWPKGQKLKGRPFPKRKKTAA